MRYSFGQVVLEETYPNSLLLGGFGRVVGTQALRVIAVAALITLYQLLLQAKRPKINSILNYYHLFFVPTH